MEVTRRNIALVNVRGSDGGQTVISCDGCQEERDVEVITDYSHEARYCMACKEIYLGWAVAMKQEEQRLQRALDLTMLETRKSLPLRFTPIDLPPPPKGLDGMRLA